MQKTRGRSARNAPTPRGLELIEKGDMVPFHPEMYSNFNTVVLEQYMEERNRSVLKDGPAFSWLKLFLMIFLVGVPFAFVTQYIALKVGIVISSLFYVAYLIGLALRWRPKEVNIISSATNLVDESMVAFAFVFPVIYLLALDPNYILSNGSRVVPGPLVPGPLMVLVVILVTIIGSVLALFHFIIFRRLWTVEEPLPTPGFESIVKLMDLSNSVQSGSTRAARSTMKKVGIAGVVAFVYAFIREYPVFKVVEVSGERTVSFLQRAFIAFGLKDWNPSPNDIYVPPAVLSETSLGLSLSALYISIGWYMRSKVALMVFAGSAFMWLFLVPLSFYLDMPYYIPFYDSYFDVNNVHALAGLSPGVNRIPARNAFTICMNMGIGTVLGAGLVAFLKAFPSIREMLFKRDGRTLGPGKGFDRTGVAYEGPSSKVPVVSAISMGLIFMILSLIGGFSLVPSLVISLFMTVVAFVIQAIAVKVAGQTGSGPTVMMVSFSLILLFLLLKPFTGQNEEGRTALLILVGTTAFIGSMVVAVTAQWDYKTGLYIGTRPIDLFKAQIAAVVVGVPICAICSTLVATEMAKGNFIVEAPWPKVYASMVLALSGGKVFYSLILLGLFVGAVIEVLTGKGAIFGLGMFFSIGIPLMILMGGFARDLWQRWVERKYGKDQDWEDKRTLKLLDSYMVMTGVFLGEAFSGLLLLIYYLTH